MLNLTLVIVRISKYKHIFPRDYVPNWPDKVFVIKEVKKNCAVDLNGEEMFGTFFGKDLQITKEKEF